MKQRKGWTARLSESYCNVDNSEKEKQISYVREAERPMESLPVVRLWLRALVNGGGGGAHTAAPVCAADWARACPSIASRILWTQVDVAGVLVVWKE